MEKSTAEIARRGPATFAQLIRKNSEDGTLTYAAKMPPIRDNSANQRKLRANLRVARMGATRVLRPPWALLRNSDLSRKNAVCHGITLPDVAQIGPRLPKIELVAPSSRK